MAMTYGNLGDTLMRRYPGVKKRKPARPNALEQNELTMLSKGLTEPTGLQERAEDRGLGTETDPLKKKKKKKRTGLVGRANERYGA